MVLNYCYETGILPFSLGQIVTVDKSRGCLKNWRPISFLSTFYKLHLVSAPSYQKKKYTGHISDSQIGFAKGRYISESIHLVYDI